MGGNGRSRRSLELGSGWELREVGTRTWLPASVPGTVQGDLLRAGRIPDPHVGMNERDVAWVGEREWEYRVRLRDVAPRDGERAHLSFDGLDTVAEVRMDGDVIAESDDMFLPLRVDVTDRLSPEGSELAIRFRSAIAVAREREAVHGAFPVWNGDPARVHLRKAAYHFGWDWGPTLLTVGPWRPVRLERFEARLAGLRIETQVGVGPEARAVVIVRPTVDPGSLDHDRLHTEVRLLAPDGAEVARAQVLDASGAARLEVGRPLLWWPLGVGGQPRYRVEAVLRDGDAELDRVERRIGLRHVELRREPIAGEAGTGFVFEINGRPTFCGGANWIPADSFLPDITPERYRRWVRLAADAGMTMLRVWGGGIYEDEAFYDACDEAGVLVWQDVMLACGIYPGHDGFVRQVEEEVTAQVERLRHHPCIVLWCGNNEDHLLARELGRYPPPPDRPDAFPARRLYEEVLPERFARLDPGRPYWPGSPFDGDDPNDPTRGDRHTWEVWHGELAPIADYARHEGRFVSEFGMIAAPAPATIAAFAPPEERRPDSATLAWHLKADDGPRRLATYLSRDYPVPADLDAWVHTTQVLQADALWTAITAWRRRWGAAELGASRPVGGALVWQLDDCWPAISWSIVDHALRPKGAYHAVRRALAPLALGAAATTSGDRVELWAMNGTDRSVEAGLVVEWWSLDGRRLERLERSVGLGPNGTTELGDVPRAIAGNGEVLAARLERDDGAVVARASLWPDLRTTPLPDPGLRLEPLEGDRARLWVDRPARAVSLEAEDGPAWADGLLDLVPSDPITLSRGEVGMRAIIFRALQGPLDQVT